MKNLKIYYIDDSYINYLRQFDKNVAYNKNTKRPYIGIVYTYNNYNYFAPLSSPKPKHKNINPKSIDIFKIKDGELGVVNINNMIPTPIEELTEVLPTVKDNKYKKMLEEQLTFLNNHKRDLFKKIHLFQNMYRKGHLNDNIKSRCCQFILLEEKCSNYTRRKVMNNLAICVQDDNKNVSPKETINAIYNAGFKDVFVQYYHRDNLEFDELKQIDYCRKLGLNIVFCHLGYKNINEIWFDGENGDKVTDEYIKDLNLMKEKQIDMVVMHLTTHREAPMYNEIGLERIKKIVKHAKELGIKIAFENTRKQGYLEYVLGNIKDENVGLCYDSGHCHVHFDDTFDYEFFKNRYFAVHLHDNDKSDDLHLLPFDGTIEWNYVLLKLKENNYTGPLTLELCYRYDYLKQSVEDFYKEGYNRGIRLEEIYNKC